MFVFCTGSILHLCVLLRSPTGITKYLPHVPPTLLDSSGLTALKLSKIMKWPYYESSLKSSESEFRNVKEEVYDVYTITSSSSNNAQSNGSSNEDNTKTGVPENIRVEGFISEVGDLVLDFSEDEYLSDDESDEEDEDSNGEGHEWNDYPDESSDSSVEGRWKPRSGWRMRGGEDGEDSDLSGDGEKDYIEMEEEYNDFAYDDQSD